MAANLAYWERQAGLAADSERRAQGRVERTLAALNQIPNPDTAPARADEWRMACAEYNRALTARNRAGTRRLNAEQAVRQERNTLLLAEAGVAA